MNKYFNGTTELVSIFPVPNAEFKAMGGVYSKTNKFDSFQRMVGKTADGQVLPVERAIKYKKNPSLHECSVKCLMGSCSGICECRCGGKNHGLGRAA